MKISAIEAMQTYLKKHNPLRAELRSTYITV